MRLVSIITVNYNQATVTEALIRSLEVVNTYTHYELIVVDNGSRENCVPGWIKKYPRHKFIRSEVNLGFAGGNNVGIATAKGDFLFLINNDTEVTADLIEKLVDTLVAHPEAGIISPKIRYYEQPDTLQYAGFTPMNYYTARNNCIGQWEKDNGQYDHYAGPTGFIHGAAMMISRDALYKAGNMAQNYFLYYEEMDWCERIRKAGFQVWINTDALIYHKESVSVGKASALKEYFMNRNRILFIRKNCALGTKLVFWAYFLAVVTPRNIINYLRHKQTPFIFVLLRAIGWNLTHNVNSTELGFDLKQ